MGCRSRELLTEDHDSCSSVASASSLSEALIFTTISIIGLPVHVHVKDGSVYSGIFHTASVHGDYGIVLKKARMTKKGKGNTNVEKEGLVDTLVVLSGDLVQVVAKGVMLAADNVGRDITGDDEEAVVPIFCGSESPTCEVENHTGSLMDAEQVNQSRYPVQNENGFAHCFSSAFAGSEYEGKKSLVNQMRNSMEGGCGKNDELNFTKIEAATGPKIDDRQAGDDKSKGKANDCRLKSEFIKDKIDEKIQGLRSTHEINSCLVQVEAVEPGSTYLTSNPSDNGLFCNNAPVSVKADDHSSERSTSADSASRYSAQGLDLISESLKLPAKSVEISAPRGADATKNAKEFKLNPAAKNFSPSFVNPITATAALPTAASMVYVPNSSPMLPVAAIQPEAGFNTFASRPSVPVKVAQYSNLTVENGGSGSQFSQPIVGHQMAHRTQPLLYATQYAPVMSELSYLQPSSPAVMVGRPGQLVYVHPVSHDLVHGATTISPVSARPLLNHVQFPKQQGGTVGQAMPVCVPPPVLTGGQQPYALQSHIPLLQPGFPVTRPISVPGPNGFFGTKFS